MADNYIFRADIGNHFAGNSAGVSAFIFPENILRTVTDMFAVDSIGNGFQSSKRREDYNLVQSSVRFFYNAFCKFYRFADCFMHFPVACNHFAAQVIQCGNTGQNFAFQIFKACTAAGRNMAYFRSKARLFNSGYTVAAAYNTYSLALGNCFGNSFRAMCKSIHFKYAHRAVPNNHFCALQSSFILQTAFRANVKRHIVLAQVFNTFNLCIGVSRKGRSHYKVNRQQYFNIVFCCFFKQGTRQFKFIFFNKRFAHFMALCGKEGISHAAADKKHVNFIQQVFNYADFIGNFCAADNCRIRMQRIGNGAANKLNFFFQQEACCSRQKMRNTFHRSMRAVRNAETIINIYIGQRSKFFRKAKVIFFFFFMETQVLQH